MNTSRCVHAVFLSTVITIALHASDTPKLLISEIQQALKKYAQSDRKDSDYKLLEKTVSAPYEKLTPLLDLEGKAYLGSTLHIFLEAGTTPDEQEIAIERLNLLRDSNHKTQ